MTEKQIALRAIGHQVRQRMEDKDISIHELTRLLGASNRKKIRNLIRGEGCQLTTLIEVMGHLDMESIQLKIEEP